MVGVVLVSSTTLDLGEFMPAAKMVTGENHVSATDMSPGISPIQDNLRILKDFAGKSVDLAPSVMYLGFMFVGMPHDISEIIEYCRGMAHLHTNKALRPEMKCVLITGNLDQWYEAVRQGCSAHEMSTARQAFNRVHVILKQNGIASSLKEVEHKDGTFLLEKK